MDSNQVMNAHGSSNSFLIPVASVSGHTVPGGIDELFMAEPSAIVYTTSLDNNVISEPGTPGSGVAGHDEDGYTEVHSTPQQPTSAMRFDSFENAYEHYRVYALRKGFGIRVDYKRTTNDGQLTRVLVVCHKAGKPRTDNEEIEEAESPTSIVKKRKRSKVVRTMCAAHMYVTRIGSWWRVNRFNDDHNHPLVRKSSLTKFLTSHRNIPSEEKEFIRVLHGCNIETSRQMQLMAMLYGSLDDVPYTSKDMANLRASFRLEHHHADIGSTIAYFQELRARDADFYWKIKLDDSDRVENIFWVDGASRNAYAKYNDCISFDTTYMTNMYKMPCAPFIGINNHGQSIQFGCGFVRNELTESFVWLFETFLDAMGGVAPKNIITDQDFAMRAGIDKVFPNTRHRNCRWHIMKKAQEKIGRLMADNEQLNEAFKDCVDNSLTVGEYEEKWVSMMEKHAVVGNEHLKTLWENRASWVPAYYMQDFYPFMQTTARSEGFNAVLKKYVNPQNSMSEFVRQYTAIQEKIMVSEEKQELETVAKDAYLWGYSPIEMQMRSICTHNLFCRFQRELRQQTSYHCEQLGGDRYKLVSLRGCAGRYGDRNYIVDANRTEGTYSRECCKFERDGMLCCHVLRVMMQIGVYEIPTRYIIKRWTWDQQADLIEPNVQQRTSERSIPEDAKRMMRYTTLNFKFKDIAKEACLSEDANRIVKSHLDAMKSELFALKKSQLRKEMKEREAVVGVTPPVFGSTESNDPRTNIYDVHSEHTPEQAPGGEGSQASNSKAVQDPPRSSTKGRPKEKAFQHPFDIAKPRKARKCRFCHCTGHDACRCPNQKSATVDEEKKEA